MKLASNMLMVLLYAQGLLGFAGLTTVVVKDWAYSEPTFVYGVASVDDSGALNGRAGRASLGSCGRRIEAIAGAADRGDAFGVELAAQAHDPGIDRAVERVGAFGRARPP